MNKIISFLKESNRWKHFVGGFLVGLCACSSFGALYSSAVAASCLELKDKLHGCPWDWLDWIFTVIGGGHYKIFCVNGNTGFRNESRIFYFIHLQKEEYYERKESSSA